MATYVSSSAGSTKRLWTGRVLSGFGAAFMLFDGIIHILKITPVVDAFAQLGYPLNTSVVLGVIEVACVVLYLLPRTAALGAVLLTGYLGGAVASQLRVQAVPFNVTFPFIVATLIWGGLYLRDQRVRALIGAR